MDKIKLQGFAPWTDNEIVDYFDTHWGVSLQKLSAMCGRSVPYIKELLMDVTEMEAKARMLTRGLRTAVEEQHNETSR